MHAQALLPTASATFKIPPVLLAILIKPAVSRRSRAPIARRTLTFVTAAGCESFPPFPAMPLSQVFGGVQLCGRSAGPPSTSLGGGDRPVPNSAGLCPTGMKICGEVIGGISAVPNWNTNRAMCFDSAVPCPVRRLVVADPLQVLLQLGVTDVNGALATQHSLHSGDVLLLFNSSQSAFTSNLLLGVVNATAASGGGNSTVRFLPGNSTLNSSGGVGIAIADILEWQFAVAYSRVSSGDKQDTPIVFAIPSTGGQVCLHSRPNQPKTFDGPGRNGVNSFTSTCSAGDVDERWTSTGRTPLQPLLERTFTGAAACTSNGSLAQRIQCADCYSFDSVCTALACDTGCSVLRTYADAARAIGFTLPNFGTEPLVDPPVTIATRQEAFWRSDCPESRQRMLGVLEPLSGIETLQRDAVVLVAVLSSVSIFFSVLQLFTLHEEGIFGVLICTPCGMALHKYGRKPCGVTDRCLGDRITQRIVISFGSVMSGVPMGLTKMIFLSVVTAQIGTVRSVLSVWADGEVVCSDEPLTNEALQRLGESIRNTFSNNLVAIIIECILIVSAASGAAAELTDGHKVCQKTIAEAQEM